MTAGPPVLPLASAGEPVRYVIIDDEPRYRQGLGAADGGWLVQVGGYGSVDDFICIQREPCHVVVLDLCLNRQTGDKAVLQGVRAIRQLAGRFGHRILVYSADPRPEPVARCVAAGAAGFVDKYNDDFAVLAQAVEEIGRNGYIVTGSLHDALRKLARTCRDVRLSDTLEETLVLLDQGLKDVEIAKLRCLSAKTIEDHKRKILAEFGNDLEARVTGFANLTRELGIAPGDIVNDRAGHRPRRGLIIRAMPWRRSQHD
jgi:two-component system, NarL family, nitrate/nitrite response regulator NarL